MILYSAHLHALESSLLENSGLKDIHCQNHPFWTTYKQILERNKLGSDLALKTGQMDTWENENWGVGSLSWGEYKSMIWAHGE